MTETDQMAEAAESRHEPEPKDRAKAAILEAAEETYRQRPQNESVPKEELSEGERIDLNSAMEDELSQLPGIGPVLGGRIVAYREEHGPFAEPAQIRGVQGISERTYEAIAERITVETPYPERAIGQPEAEPGEPEEVVEEEKVTEELAVEAPEPEEEPAEETGEVPEAEEGEEPAEPPEEEPAEEAEEEWEVPVPEPQEVLPEPEGLEAAKEGRVLPEPEAAEAEPAQPPPELPKQKVVVEHREPGGWGRLLLMALAAMVAGAGLALLILYAVNGTLSFRTAANQALAGTVSRLEADIEVSRIELGQLQERMGEIDDLRARLGEAEGNIAGLARDLETAQSDLQDLNQGLNDVRQTLGNLSDDLVSLAETVTALNEQVGAIDERLRTVESDLAVVEEELEVVRAAAQRFDAFLTGLRDLLNEAEGLPSGSQPAGPTPTAWETLTPIPSPTPEADVTVIPLATPVPTTTPTPSG
jgi:competence ComEA-like helix-hairpin-helix protein